MASLYTLSQPHKPLRLLKPNIFAKPSQPISYSSKPTSLNPSKPNFSSLLAQKNVALVFRKPIFLAKHLQPISVCSKPTSPNPSKPNFASILPQKIVALAFGKPNILAKLSQPISVYSKPTSPNPSIINFALLLAQKIVVLAVGTIVLMGCFRSKPSFAVSSLEEKLVESEPRNVEALKVLVYGKMRGGKMEDAVGYLTRLVDIEPEEVEWKLLLALCYENMGELGSAKELFREVLRERPLLLRALHGLAVAMHKNHEGPAVFEMLDKALEVARHKKKVSEERNIKILIAQMHVVKGELEDGLKKLQALIDEDPRDFRPYLCRGIIYSLLDKKKEAAEQFELYRSLVPEEFPERGFLDDVVLAAKTKPGEHLQKEFQAEFSYSK